jgi:hypothetical protein
MSPQPRNIPRPSDTGAPRRAERESREKPNVGIVVSVLKAAVFALRGLFGRSDAAPIPGTPYLIALSVTSFFRPHDWCNSPHALIILLLRCEVKS